MTYSPPGMRHFAGTGPAGQTCGGCTHHMGERNGLIVKVGPCAAYQRVVSKAERKKPKKIPPSTPACKYWAART